MKSQLEDRYGPRMAKKVLSVITAVPPATYTVFTLTGRVVVRMFAVCTDAVLSGGAPTIEMGVAGDTACIVALTNPATQLIAGEWWYDNAPVATVIGEGTAALEFVLSGGQDVIVTIGGAGAPDAVTAGELEITAYWRNLSDDGSVQAA